MPRISKSQHNADDAFDGTVVDLDDPEADLGEFEFVDGDNGAPGQMVEVQQQVGLVDPVGEEHGANLAEILDPAYLAKLGSDIVETVERDRVNRQPWVDRYERGMAMLGLIDSDVDDGPFPGSSTAILPLLSEAQVAFWARALPELFPSEGPAKAKVMGRQSDQLTKRGERVKDFLNYEMMVVDRAYYAETSRMVAAVPFQGCSFRKTFWDHLMGHTAGIFVPAEDLIVPSNAASLASAPHYTHRYFRTPNELRKLQVGGVFVDIDLGAPIASSDDEIKSMKKEMEDVEENDDPETANHELYEHYCELDLPGYEDVYPDAPEEQTGIALPYVVTVDRSSGEVLAVYRNWRLTDKRKQGRVQFTKYSYLPGVGFYDFGLFHLLGGLQEAATGALRTLLDGAAMASLQGGFVAKDANIKAERLTIEPGVWKPIESTAEEFNKAFLTPPFREPSPTLFQLMGILTSSAQRFTSTTEAMSGESGGANQPVGTTVALIEQGHKVYSAIHRGLHSACSEELAIRMELAAEHAPADGYPYDPDGTPRTVYAEDFGAGVTIIPVSDPNIFSTTQRIQISQAVMQAADQHPDLVDRKVAIRRYFEAIKVPDIPELMSVSTDPEPMDPVSENAAMLRQVPVKAFPDQDHMAHIMVHGAFLMHPGYGGHPQVAGMLGPVMQAHLAEHLGYLYQMQARQAGVPVPMLDPIHGKPAYMEVPPEAIAAMAAQLAPIMGRMRGLPSPEQIQAGGQPPQQPAQQPPPGPDPAAGAQEQAMIGQAKVQAIQATTQAKLEGMAATTQAKLQVKAAEDGQKLASKQAEADIKRSDREHAAFVKQVDRIADHQHRQEVDQADVARMQIDLTDKAREVQLTAAGREHKHVLDAQTRDANASRRARKDKLDSLRPMTAPEENGNGS